MNYQEIQKRIAELQSQAEAIRQKEVAAVIADIRDKIKLYGISANDLGLVDKISEHRVTPKPPLPPKYRNSVDPSLTWSGRGRKPQWIETYLANNGDLSKLLIR